MLYLLLTDAQRHWTGVLAVAALLVTAVLTLVQPVSTRVVALGGLFELDRMAQALKVVTLLTVSMVFVYSTDYLHRRALLKGEYYVLGLFATLGGMVLISAGSLITLYMGLELMSLCLYAMVAFDRESGIAAESAIKYFVLGSMASGTLLYGMSILYGVTGSLELAAIANAVQGGFADNIGLIFGIAFLIVGIGFKLGAVPFHMWIPDVYEGSPTCVTVFIGTASKLAAFALAMRLLPEALAARLESDAGGAVGPVDRHRQRGCDSANQSQADAGLLDHFPGGLHSARHLVGHRAGLSGGDVLHGELCDRGERGIRHDSALGAAGV
jgi:NADH-quinone oxidoreductase subunit N